MFVSITENLQHQFPKYRPSDLKISKQVWLLKGAAFAAGGERDLHIYDVVKII